MSILVYKQRFQNPNLKTTASKNYAHVRYIATRPRVAKNEGMDHGLFGKLKPGEIEEFKNWKDIARLVYRNSREHIIMYRSIISFDEKTAQELMLNDHKAWQRYIENHIMTIATQNNIKREHLQWACAMHKERRHPHLHVVFWDTSNRVKNPFTPPAIPNAIRRQMIKETFAERIRVYGEQKNMAVEQLRKISDKLVDEFDHYIRKPGSLLQDEAELEGLYDLDNKILETIAERVLQIKTDLPPKGRIAYQLLPPEVKKQVDELVQYLLEQVPALNKMRTDYVDSKMQMTVLYGGSDEYFAKMKLRFEGEADKIIANRILGMVKGMNRLEAEGRNAEYRKNRQSNYVEQMLLEALDMLAGLIETTNQDMADWDKKYSGELSKEARKELYLKYQDKGYEH